MMQIYKYETEEEMNQIIADKTALGLILVAVSNVTEGNFLGFSDSPNPPKTPIEEEIAVLKQRDAQLQDDNNLIFEALITANLL